MDDNNKRMIGLRTLSDCSHTRGWKHGWTSHGAHDYWRSKAEFNEIY